MNDKPEQLITATTRIQLNAQERSAMRHMLGVFVDSYMPRRRVLNTFGTFLGRHAAAYSAAAVLVLAGGTTALADHAVPGDILYPVRISVNDRVAVAVAGGEDARLDKEMEQIERVIDEEEAAADIELESEAEDLEDEDRSEEPQGRGSTGQEHAAVNASAHLSARADTQEDIELGHELDDLSAEIDDALKDTWPWE